MDRTTRQFSLQRLLVGVVVVSFVLAAATSFPVVISEWVTVNLLLIAPASIVSGIAFWRSKQRKRTSLILLAGNFAGWLLAPRLQVNWSRPPTFWDNFLIDFETIGVCMFGGAIVAAMADFVISIAGHQGQGKMPGI